MSTSVLLVDKAICPICGKEIHFSIYMPKNSFAYKRYRKGKTLYYCGYNHYLKG